MNKKNKKGFMGIKFIIIAILSLLFLSVVIPIFLNKNTWDDFIDRINNFFQPPEIDPMDTPRVNFENRRQAENYYEAWLRAYNTAMNSNEETCYTDLPPMPSTMIENGYYLLFISDSKDNMMTQLTHSGMPVVKAVPINTGLCMIIDDNDDKKILENFHEQLIKKFNPRECTHANPCHYHFLKDVGIHSTNMGFGQEQHVPEDYDLQEAFNNIVRIQGTARVEIPVPEKENSMNIKYTKITNNNVEEIINSTTTSLSEKQAFRLVKINNQVCILPLDSRTYTNQMFQKRDDLHYFKQGIFDFTMKYPYAESDYKGIIPKCQKDTHQLLDNINNPITIVFSILRSGPLSNTHYPQKIYYSNNEWTAEFALNQQINPLVGTKHIKNNQITDYLNNLLENKNYQEGVKKLCDEFVFNQEVNAPSRHTVTLIEGLRCELVQRTEITTPPDNQNTNNMI